MLGGRARSYLRPWQGKLRRRRLDRRRGGRVGSVVGCVVSQPTLSAWSPPVFAACSPTTIDNATDPSPPHHKMSSRPSSEPGGVRERQITLGTTNSSASGTRSITAVNAGSGRTSSLPAGGEPPASGPFGVLPRTPVGLHCQHERLTQRTGASVRGTSLLSVEDVPELRSVRDDGLGQGRSMRAHGWSRGLL